MVRKVQSPQFGPIQRRLLWANVMVFGLVLGGFAIALRTAFTYTLRQQQHAQLQALSRSAAAVAEWENGQIEVDSDDLAETALLTSTQGVQWFTAEGELIDQLGTVHPPEKISKVHSANADSLSPETTTVRAIPLQSLTQTVTPQGEPTHTTEVIYVRVSQSLAPYHTTLRQLDRGLGIGSLVALGISAVGVLWLNRQAMGPIEASFDRLRQFTADASHELRNPIMAITSNAEFALRYPDGMRADDKETLEAIMNAAEQMTDLTQDLLLLTRLDQHVSIERTPVDLSQLLTNLIRLYQPQAQNKIIDVRTQIAPNLSLMGHAPQLVQAFTNLLQNALRYTPSGGTITVSSGQTPEGIWIAVQDTGIGIAPENIPQIFDRFWRADQARSAVSGGSGLGLPIAQAVIQSHGGTLDVSSQFGKGSCFTVHLPADSSP
ncbi:MAG: HAMP domain-containing sensor histidine kinase [Cyanobacteria bacterium J06632_22]